MKALALTVVIFFMMVPVISHAILWDFSDKAQEADWEVIAAEGGIDDTVAAYKLHNPTAEARVITGASDWTDYTIKCKVRLTEAGTFQNIALLWRISEGKDYLLMLEAGRQQAEWYKNTGGGYGSIQNDALAIDANDWFEFKLVVTGDTFDAYYNGELINTVTDGDLKTGGVGVRIYGCTTHMDDFEITGPGIDTTAVEAAGKIATTWGSLKK